MKNGKTTVLAVQLILLIPVIYLAFVYGSLPQTVAVHFGIDGKPNRFGSKTELLTGVLIMTIMAEGMFLLLRNIHKIDPKKSAKFSADSMNKIATGIVILFAAINILIVYSTINNEFVFHKLILSFVGLFFAFLGNVMYSVKQNYFVGIRTPWTLESEDIWRKTHQLGGKLWFAGGLLMTIVTLLLNAAASVAVFLSVAGFIVIVPIVYSYILFKKAKTN